MVVRSVRKFGSRSSDLKGNNVTTLGTDFRRRIDEWIGILNEARKS